MATSGVVTFRSNRNEIIKGALRLVGGYDPENTAGPTATQISDAAEALNMMIKSPQWTQLHLSLRRYAVLFPQKDQGVFVFGSPGPGGDHACLTTPMGGGFVQTQLSSDAASGATTIVVDTVDGLSTAGITLTTITNGYNIGVELDDGSTYWTTVNGAPSGTSVTLAVGLTSAATEGNNVFCYQTKLLRPLRVLDAFMRQLPTGSDSPIRVISREEYNRYGLKSAASITPNQLYHDVQNNTAFVYIYPVFQSADTLLFMEITKPIEDFVNSTDDFDLPQEYGEALKYGLALRIAPEYEVPNDKFKQISALATASFAMVDSYDQEVASVLIQPNTWMYGNGRT